MKIVNQKFTTLQYETEEHHEQLLVNWFVPNDFFLYPLKTSEKKSELETKG